MDIRRATEHDLIGIAAARRSNGRAHHDSGVNPSYCAFLIDHGHLWVAVDGDDVAGFGGAIDVGDARLLSDLYVHRAAHGRGIGSALLDEVLRGARFTFTFASDDPAAQTIYARAGMAPTWVLSTLRGAVHPLDGEGLATADVDLAVAAAFEGGGDRHEVLRYWASRPGTRVLGAFDGATMVGVAVVHLENDTARIEHLVADRDLAGAVLAAVVQGAEVVEVYVPEVRPLHGHLLAAGLTVHERAVFMTSRSGVVGDRLQVVHPGLA